MELTVIVPTCNEASNVAEIVRRVEAACEGFESELIFVDDSRDETPQLIRQVVARTSYAVRLIHRDVPAGGLGGAVIEGMRASNAEHCLVMNGGLQHPPEMIPAMLEQLRNISADIVVASRYCGGNSARGLAGWLRHPISYGSTLLARGLFPLRLKNCTDPMTGFFAFRRRAVDVNRLRPTGFKTLLEILARTHLRVMEVPLVGQRLAGDSKSSFRESTRDLRQLAGLRFGRIAGFGAVGGLGAVLNLLIMGVLMAFGVHFVLAAVIAAETTILSNFLMQERLVFHADRGTAHRLRRRFLQSFAFNNVDAAARLPILWALVEFLGMGSLLAQASTLVAAFLLRYLYHSRVVYRPATVYTVRPRSVATGRGRTMTHKTMKREPAGVPPSTCGKAWRY